SRCWPARPPSAASTSASAPATGPIPTSSPTKSRSAPGCAWPPCRSDARVAKSQIATQASLLQEPVDLVLGKGPIELAIPGVVAEDGDPEAVARFQAGIVVDEDAFELRGAGRGQYLQRQVAQLAVVALEQQESAGHPPRIAAWQSAPSTCSRSASARAPP